MAVPRRVAALIACASCACAQFSSPAHTLTNFEPAPVVYDRQLISPGPDGNIPSLTNNTRTSDSLPEQVRINLGLPQLSDPGLYTYTVGWATAAKSDSMVMYGEGSDLSKNATGVFETYTYDGAGFYNETIDGSNNTVYTSPYLHRADMVNIKPNSQYSYKVGDPKLGFSDVRTFKTPPAVGDTVPWEWAAIADLGQTLDSLTTQSHVLQDPKPLLLMHAGDQSYADCTQPRWDSYGRMIDPMVSQIPHMSCAANHEVEVEPKTGRVFTAFEARHKLPAIKPAEFDDAKTLAIAVASNTTTPPSCAPSSWLGRYDFGNAFYSFDVANAHFIVTTQYTSSAPGSEQASWLQSDLLKIDRKKTPWIFVMFHGPYYNTNSKHQGEAGTIQFQKNVEDIFYQNKVALAFAGHVHAYERTTPLYKNVTTAGAPVYITIGDGGNREGHSNTFLLPTPSWSAARNGDSFGHGRVKVMNATHALWEWRQNVGGDVKVGDSTYIINPYSG